MWCVKCQNDVSACTCPDIEERLRRVQSSPNLFIPNCPAGCGKPRAICKCGYMEYHRQVVEECVKLMGEQSSAFFDLQCDYVDAWKKKTPAAEEAEAQWDALQDSM